MSQVRHVRAHCTAAGQGLPGGVCQFDANLAGLGVGPGWHGFCAEVVVALAAADARPDAHNNEETPMISIDRALLRQLLFIERPWEVREYRLDLRQRRCDVWIAQEATDRSWFGRVRKVAIPTDTVVWQHMALGAVRFHLHVALPVGLETRGVNWMGEPGMPFSRALAARVFALFNEGLSVQSVCSLLDLSLQDVWRYRYALDTGRAGAGQPTAAAERAVAPATAAALAVTDDSAVPDVTDPIWLRLLDGDMSLDIKVLSLKLMLTRLRSQLDLIHDDEVRLLKLKELHRYFVKNERVLNHELAQLRPDGAA